MNEPSYRLATLGYDAVRVPRDSGNGIPPLVLARVRRRDDDTWLIELLPDVKDKQLPWQMFPNGGVTVTDPLAVEDARAALAQAADLVDRWIDVTDREGHAMLEAFSRLGKRPTIQGNTFTGIKP